MSKIISWRTANEDYYGGDNFKMDTWAVNDVNMDGKTLVMDRVIVVANFTEEESTTTVEVSTPGQWKNLLSGESVTLGSTYDVTLGGSDYIVLVRD